MTVDTKAELELKQTTQVQFEFLKLYVYAPR